MDKDALLNKFKSMGVQLGTQNLAKPASSRRKPAYPIESVVEGADHPTIFGDAFVTSQHYSLDYRHGKVTLCSEANCDVLSAWSQSARILQPGGENVVFLDTETSGLAGGTGTYVFLIGIGYRTAQGFDLVQFFMRDPAQEAALIAALDQWLARFDVVVTFNGKTFDIPLLSTRYQMNGLTSPGSSGATGSPRGRLATWRKRSSSITARRKKSPAGLSRSCISTICAAATPGLWAAFFTITPWIYFPCHLCTRKWRPYWLTQPTRKTYTAWTWPPLRVCTKTLGGLSAPPRCTN